MKRVSLIVVLLAASSPTFANDWERNYHPYGPTDNFIPSKDAPEVLPSTGNPDSDFEGLWRRGFIAIGYTSFNSINSKTDDAKRFAKKLRARYLILVTNLSSSSSGAIPITTPTTSTTISQGTANAYGRGGYAHGTYSGTSTTYGSPTTMIPYTINRFDKFAVYFMEFPKKGTGIMPRDLTPEEVATYETRKAFVVRWVRDGSPAYDADILPGDVVLSINGRPADSNNVADAVRSGEPLQLRIMRKGQPREITMFIPAEWRP